MTKYRTPTNNVYSLHLTVMFCSVDDSGSVLAIRNIYFRLLEATRRTLHPLNVFSQPCEDWNVYPGAII